MEDDKCKLCGTGLESMDNPYLCSWCEGSNERDYPDNRGYGLFMAL